MSTPYHHGSLREALVDAATQVVTETGSESLSLRALARRAGVSSGAPYRHFTDRDAVLCAVATNGFRRFDAALANTDEQSATLPPVERVEQLGVAYVRFAAEEPNLFRLMFGPLAPRVGVDAELDEVRRRAGAHLPRALTRAQAAGFGTDSSLEELVELAWALVHGVAALHLDGLAGSSDVAGAEQLARRVTGQLGRLMRSDK